MAGIFSRGFSKCSRSFQASSFGSKARYANSSRSKSSTTFQRRKLQGSKSRGHAASVLFINNKLNLLESRLPPSAVFANSTSPILNAVQTAGLHLSATVAVGEGSAGISVSDAAAETSDNTVDPLLNSISSISNNNLYETLPFETTQEILASGLEAPISSLGLGGYTPVGLIQTVLELTHTYIGLPWWGAIVAGTLVFRILVFPIMVKGQVNSARLQAVKPELERIQEKMREVSNLQNPMAKAQASFELQDLFKKHNCHPAKALIAPLVQLPLFVSFFLALRQMSYLPMDALKVGGVLWFPDLTAADPYFILPVACAATMLLTIETGAEASMANPQMQTMKNVFRGMCFVMIPLTYTFPTAIFLYWMTSNTFSLAQVAVLKVPAVKNYFGIPEPMTIHPTTDSVVKQGSFFENLKAGYNNAKEAAIIKNSDAMKERNYKSSKEEIYQETFEYNPKLKQNAELFEEAKKHKS